MQQREPVESAARELSEDERAGLAALEVGATPAIGLALHHVAERLGDPRRARDVFALVEIVDHDVRDARQVEAASAGVLDRQAQDEATGAWRRHAVEHEAVLGSGVARREGEDERGGRDGVVVGQEATAPSGLLQRPQHGAQVVLEPFDVVGDVAHHLPLGVDRDAGAAERDQLRVLARLQPALEVDR